MRQISYITASISMSCSLENNSNSHVGYTEEPKSVLLTNLVRLFVLCRTLQFQEEEAARRLEIAKANQQKKDALEVMEKKHRELRQVILVLYVQFRNEVIRHCALGVGNQCHVMRAESWNSLGSKLY